MYKIKICRHKSVGPREHFAHTACVVCAFQDGSISAESD